MCGGGGGGGEGMWERGRKEDERKGWGLCFSMLHSAGLGGVQGTGMPHRHIPRPPQNTHTNIHTSPHLRISELGDELHKCYAPRCGATVVLHTQAVQRRDEQLAGPAIH